ncbi:leucine-rich repeat domain-containing protein, partial [bacterium]|nr:leucine-rich repeat domain-containing protein [bacterium]
MQKLLSLFVVLFSLSLFGGWGADLCEDVTCSGHGECHDDGENEWCVCDEGYIADGMECILGCNGVTCSGHGVCSVVSGAEVCTCEAGFHASGLNCILDEASTVDTLAILNSTECYNTGNCHYRLIFATGAYDFTPSIASLYDIIVNVLDSENVWHNYRKTVAQCVTEGVCDNVDAQYIDFWFQHNVNGNQYVTVEILGNGDDASDDMYHDVLIDYCYGVNCGTGGSCNGTSGYPVCTCEYGYVLRGGICEEGWFEDENLAAEVVELLKHKGFDVETETDIEPEMLSDIEYLALRRKNISSLVGIGHFSSLTVLDISENNISDLSPLEDCLGLTVLNMSYNPASDLSPLSGLPLSSLDISYSGVYNLHPLTPIAALTELIFADTENDRHGIIKPEGVGVGLWFDNLNLLECKELVPIKGSIDNTYKVGIIGTGGDCPAHGSCIAGKCVCDEGYIYSAISNSCFDPYDCGTGSHYNAASGNCEDNKYWISCSENDESNKKFSDNYLIWNGTSYELPAGYTNSDLCRIGDETCDIAGEKSLCRWECKPGYQYVTDDICVPENDARFISQSAYNQLILPNISRQDIALEPVSGIPSFAPALKADIYYNARNSLQAGWHLDLPRVELNLGSFSPLAPLYSWNQKTIYVYMPWGREEYSIVADKKCFNSENAPISPCKTSYDLSEADHVEITYYPAPGQNLFSHVVLKTTGKACKISFSNNGKYFDGEGRGKDTWEITRYGDDGSVTEFYRGRTSMNSINPIPIDIPLNIAEYAPRPSSYVFMDYIPILRHTTRDKKVTSFKYDWQRITIGEKEEFSHYIIKSVNIIDPLKRVVKIESDSTESGLTGKPNSVKRLLYEPLEGTLTISVGSFDDNDNPLEPLKKVIEYDFEDGFEMSAEIYKGNDSIRTDSYSENGNVFSLSSTTGNDSVGGTIWTVNTSGYTEKKLINGSSEYVVKTVKGKFYKGTQRFYEKYYSLLLPENEDDRHKVTTVYRHKKGAETINERIVEEYFTDWFQPAKRVTCTPVNYEDEDCSESSESAVEEIRYNVSGSPIYFKNADGQVTVNLYNRNNAAGTSNYTVHFYQIPSSNTYINFNSALNLNLNIFRSDSLRKSGNLLCSAVYSLNADDDEINSMLIQYAYNLSWNPNWCSNAENRRVTNYEWRQDGFWMPYDIDEITYPDGKTRTFTYDYEITTPEGYISNGKVWGETITGSNNENTLQTCYEYNNDYQLIKQGIGPAGSGCDYKKGFDFDSTGLLMTQDYSFDENLNSVLTNDYIYDSLGRKIAERNSAGISTTYVYDSLDRVVFSFFGCKLNNNNSSAFENRVYTPYNFNGSDTAGENGLGVNFQSAFPYSDFTCEYYRKYKYDAVSNLVETYFFEYLGVNANNQVVPLDSPKIIKQKTEYDMLGRAVRSCQSDILEWNNRCIETEHDAFGNITKKTENGLQRMLILDQGGLPHFVTDTVSGESREITYDLRNRPLTVTVDGLTTEQYSYDDIGVGYFGCDKITNKYEKTVTTYKDRWGRAAKSVDPFGNNVEPHYNSTTWLTDYSKTYNGTTLTSFDAYEYDDLGRISTVKKVLFDPASNTSNAAATSISGIAAKEMILEKSVSYDPVTGSVVAVEDSFGNETVKVYDSLNRVIKVENYDADNQLVSSVRTAYDTTGRISAEQNWTSAKTTVTEYDYDNMGRVIATCVSTTNATETDDCIAASCTFTDTKCSYQLYNTGGQVVWSADTETGGITYLLPFVNIDLVVGNETVYDYNAFGEVVKTARRMTADGLGGSYTETQLYNSDGWITTNYTYDILGRNTEKSDDNGARTYYTYTVNNLPETEKYCGSDDSDCDYPREVTYTYNSKRDLISETYEQSGNTLTVNYGRDNYGRISQKYTGTTATDVYQTFTYNNRNLLETAKSVDPTNTTSTLSEVTRTYDSFGNIKSETFDSGTVSSAIAWNPTTKVMTETITLPSGKNIVETTLKGLPKTLEYDGSKLLQYNYGTGNVLTSIRKNFDLQDNYSAELAYTYNNWRKVSRRTEEFTAQNAPTVADYEYTYSKGLHLIGKQENEENRRTAYQYDSYYRLRRVDYDCAYSSSDPTCANNRNNVFKCNAAESGCEDFQLDGVHNIRSSYENQTGFSWAVDGFNRLTQKSDGSNTVKYTYDSNNNMTGEDLDGDNNPEIVYTYDKLNRLTSVANSDYLVEYSYDPFNRRTEKTVYYTENSDTYEQTHK